MLEKYLANMNMSKEEVLKISQKIKLSKKEIDALEKGKKFIDKQMELSNDTMRQEVAIALLAYIIEEYSNN